MSTDNVKNNQESAPEPVTKPVAKTNPKPKPSQEEPDLVILHRASCPKLSERAKGELDYQVGYSPTATDLYIRITSNHSGGYFSKEWVPLSVIQTCLPSELDADSGSSDLSGFSARVLTTAFVSKSQNNAGFLAAALLSEGLIAKTNDKQHVLQLGVVSFTAWSEQWLKQGAQQCKTKQEIINALDQKEGGTGLDSEPDSEATTESNSEAATKPEPEPDPTAESPAAIPKKKPSPRRKAKS